MKLNHIYQGDVINRLKDLPDRSIQCVVTSPPYWGLRDYGVEGQLGLEETPELYVENMVEVFREIKRVLKKDGTVWLNLGDSYSSGSGGYDDKYMHNSTSGTPSEGVRKSVSASKPFGLPTKNLVGIPWRVAFALQADGWYLRQDIIWHKPNPMPESVRDRCTKAHEYIFLLSKSAKYKFNQMLEDLKPSTFNDKRLFNGNYTEQRRDRNYPGNAQQGSGMLRPTDGQANKRSVWRINTKPYKEAHFAVFPPKIPELCIKAGTKEGDTVLDPFFGSGTTGWVAQRLGRKWIGIELNAEYIKIAEKRFAQKELFQNA
jgi:DNA modification methylase